MDKKLYALAIVADYLNEWDIPKSLELKDKDKKEMLESAKTDPDPKKRIPTFFQKEEGKIYFELVASDKEKDAVHYQHAEAEHPREEWGKSVGMVLASTEIPSYLAKKHNKLYAIFVTIRSIYASGINPEETTFIDADTSEFAIEPVTSLEEARILGNKIAEERIASSLHRDNQERLWRHDVYTAEVPLELLQRLTTSYH